MTFSNVNVFRSAILNLNASAPGANADKITRGGAFAPNTQEAIAIMRSDIDILFSRGQQSVSRK